MKTINTIKMALAAVEAFTDPEGRIPAETGEFNDLKACIPALRDALQAHEEAQTGGPDWYHAECDDPDYSGFHQELGDAETQISEHGGYITELFTRPAPPPSGERAELIARLRNGSNWLIQGYGSFKDCVSKYDRAPFEAADMLAADAMQASESAAAERDELRAKLSALEGQEAVAVVTSETYPHQGFQGISYEAHIKCHTPLYLAAGAAQPVSAAVPDWVVSALHWAESLIVKEYPHGHNGADSWLMNYGELGGTRIRELDHRSWGKVGGRWMPGQQLAAAPQPPAPSVAVPSLDVCTDGANCQRCKTHKNYRGDIAHAGIPVGNSFGANPSAPSAKPLPLTDELRKFLNGEGPLDGAWFGDLHPTRKGKFWWREFLPAAANGVTQEPT